MALCLRHETFLVLNTTKWPALGYYFGESTAQFHRQYGRGRGMAVLIPAMCFDAE